MSIALMVHDRRNGVEEGESRLAGQRSMAAAQRRRGERARGDDDAVPTGRRQPGDLAALDRDERMRFELPCHLARKSRRDQPPARHPPAAYGGRPRAMMSEPARRISSCSRPTALVSASSERKEFEQTSSASPPVLCASVMRCGAHLVEDHGYARSRDLPGGLAPGKPAADDMDGGVWHAAASTPGCCKLQREAAVGKPRSEAGVGPLVLTRRVEREGRREGPTPFLTR